MPEEAKGWWDKLKAFAQEFAMWKCQLPCEQCPFDVVIEGTHSCSWLVKVVSIADSAAEKKEPR